MGCLHLLKEKTRLRHSCQRPCSCTADVCSVPCNMLQSATVGQPRSHPSTCPLLPAPRSTAADVKMSVSCSARCSHSSLPLRCFSVTTCSTLSTQHEPRGSCCLGKFNKIKKKKKFLRVLGFFIIIWGFLFI